MPSSYAHYRFGSQMLQCLPHNVKAAAESFRRLYDMGTHGPDLFFFYRPLVKTPVGRLGKKYHMISGEDFFSGAVSRLGKNCRREDMAYLYGLLTHYALDSVCHPYVKQAQDAGLAEHAQMETEFDRLLLETDGLLTPKPRLVTGHMRLSRQESQVVARVFPEVAPRQLREAAFTMGALTKQFACRTQVKYSLGKKLLGSRFSQFLMRPDPDPRCQVTNERLLDLYGQAQSRFDTLCTALTSHMRNGTPLGAEFDLAFDVM